jgi:gamma-glutamyltranspeptidase/glutathione hydrolase
MAVSNTYTLEASFGSKLVVRNAGFLLNNELGDFNWFPGETTRTGRLGTTANEIEPGKRMLISQSPVLVTCNGRIALITGSPGGRTILSTVLGILVDQLIFQTTLEDALDAPRLHHQWLPDRIQFEGANDPRWAPLLAALRELGHQVVPASHERGQGSAHSISVDPHLGLRTGIADTRRGGAAAGQ